jgi:hypothetical protein
LYGKPIGKTAWMQFHAAWQHRGQERRCDAVVIKAFGESTPRAILTFGQRDASGSRGEKKRSEILRRMALKLANPFA